MANGLPPPLIAVLDANVLFPVSLRDLLLRAVEKDLYRLRISQEIWTEVVRNLVASGRMVPEQATYLDSRMQVFLIDHDALVAGYEGFVPTLANAPTDRHVLAAAIHAQAATIVSFNLRDFPSHALSPYGVVAEHPDAFLCRLYIGHEEAFAQIVREQAAALRRPPLTLSDVFDALAQHVPTFVSLLRPSLEEPSLEVKPDDRGA